MVNAPQVVDKHYRNADVEKEDAEKFWSLTRERVLHGANVETLPTIGSKPQAERKQA